MVVSFHEVGNLGSWMLMGQPVSNYAYESEAHDISYQAWNTDLTINSV